MKKNIWKRLIPMALALVLAVGLLPVAARAATGSGPCGTGVTWTLTNNGTVTISGSGAMDDYGDYTKTPWRKIATDREITKVIVGTDVTKIGKYAFDSNLNLTSVEIKGSATLSGYACSNNSNLTTVTYGGTVTGISNKAFVYCDKLNSFTLREGIGLSGYAFGGCYNFKDSSVKLLDTDGNDVTSYYSVSKDTFNSANVRIVVKADLSKGSIADIPEQVYTGSEIKPAVTVTWHGQTVDPVNYVVTYENNTEPGTATVTVTGKDSKYYTGTLTQTFTITQPLTMDPKPQPTNYEDVYDGEVHGIIPVINVPTGGTVTYSETENGTYSEYCPGYTNAGNYTVYYKVTAPGYYPETGSGTVKITPRSLEDVTLEGLTNELYSGEEIKPPVTMTYNGKTLTEGTDYTLSYENNINVGTATVTITGKGNFAGTRTKNFAITPAGIYIDVEVFDGVYDGNPHGITITAKGIDSKPATVKYGTVVGTYDRDTSPTLTNVGSMTVYYQVTLANHTTVTGHETITINKKALESSMAALTPTSGTYTGEVHNPEVPLSYGGETLQKDRDYTLTGWSGDMELPGTYTATVTAVEGSNFTGSIDLTYTVTNAALTDVSVSQTGTLTYNGQLQTPEVNASASSQGGQEVTFTYSTAPDGTYGDLPSFTTATIRTVYYKASAQYHDDVLGSFKVTIDRLEITPPTIASKVYNGQKQTADIPESDLYTVEENLGGTEGGEYNVQLTLADPDNYCWPDSHTPHWNLTFTITPADNAWVTEPTIAGWTYGVAPSAPAMGEPVYGKETTYVSYVGTTNAGVAYESTEAPTAAGDYRAVFTVPATSSYGVLTKEVPFSVNRAALPADRFDYSEPGLTYNGLERSVTVTTILEGVDAEDITLNYFANGNAPATPRDAGFYTFTVSVAQSDNYEAANLTSDDWKFTINKAEPVISWDVTEFTYNARPQGEAKVTLENNETYNGTIQYTYGESVEGLPTDAGTYILTVSIAEQDNYYAASSQATIVIKAKEVTPTVVLTPDTYTYDGEAKHPAVKVMDGETVIPDTEYTVTWGDVRNVGPANAWILEKAGGNYTIAQNTKGVFLILPDTSALEGVTTENVNSSHQAAIDEIQAAMDGKNISEASEAAQKQWNDLLALCTALEAKISDAKTGSDAITAGIAALPEQPTTDDLHDIQEMLDQYAAIEENLTDAEKEALKDEIEKLEALEEAIEDTNSDLKEITDGTGALNKDDLDFADKAAIADLQKKIDDLEDDPYLTDTQKQTLEDAEEKLAELEAEFEEADKVSEQLNQLPATANPDAKTAVEAYEAAKKAYEDLGEDKSKVAPAAVKKLEALKKELTDYKITKGNGAKWAKGSSDGLSFTANGYFGKFTGVKIDGKLIDSSNYTAKSGSTIVTLNASYLQKLKTGNHTIAICFGDGDFTGEASGEFKVVTNNGNPFTGDNSNILLWSGVAVISLLCLATMLWFIFRKKGKHQR